MSAVLKHELKNYFQSLTAYIFGAFLLLAVGIGSMLYNLSYAVSNFEYVFYYGSFAFVVIVPILTMRTIAEERKQKTDQLIYSLPVTTTEVVLGKYVALLAVFVLPLLVICFYPFLFAQYGEVYLLTAYGSILAFFLLGAALLAMGIFISSLTDSQGLAAGIGIAVILFNYFSVSLSEYVSATATGTVISFFVIIVAIWAVVNHLTKNENLAYAVGFVLLGILCVTFWFDAESFEGLLPEIMTTLSLFSRFDVFVSGIFDLTGVVYYLSVAALFLFLSVQSLEKRRYN